MDDLVLWGVRVTLIGMGVTFLVLITLAFILGAFKQLFARDRRPTAVPTESIPAGPSTPAVEVSGPAEGSDRQRVVAVIAAAVAAYLGRQVIEINITKVKRIGTAGSPWQAAGRSENIAARQRLYRRGNQ